jgi:hypothetical protein
LHDLLGRTLSLIAVKAELASRLSATGDPSAEAELRDVQRLARHAVREVREAVTGDRAPSVAAELAAARLALRTAGIEVSVDDAAPDIDPAHEATVAWALREAVTNVVKHSGARTCRIAIEAADGATALEVVDDGRGRPAGLGGSGGLAEGIALGGASRLPGGGRLQAPGARRRGAATAGDDDPRAAGRTSSCSTPRRLLSWKGYAVVAEVGRGDSCRRGAGGPARRGRGRHRAAGAGRHQRGGGTPAAPARLPDADPDDVRPTGLPAARAGRRRRRLRAEGRAGGGAGRGHPALCRRGPWSTVWRPGAAAAPPALIGSATSAACAEGRSTAGIAARAWFGGTQQGRSGAGVRSRGEAVRSRARTAGCDAIDAAAWARRYCPAIVMHRAPGSIARPSGPRRASRSRTGGANGHGELAPGRCSPRLAA